HAIFSSYFLCFFVYSYCYLFSFFLSFFFKLYRHHLDLHSFPTRRSSDLVCLPRGDLVARGQPVHVFQIARLVGIHAAVQKEPVRSEEHTSELQSHLNLVCRLLLEKKNKNTL